MAGKDEAIAISTQSRHVEDNEDVLKSELNEIEDSTPGLFLNLCVVATAIGGMLFG